METHLTLKHLAPYLPYGLKVLVTDNSYDDGIYNESFEVDYLGRYQTTEKRTYCIKNSYTFIQHEAKPILRPLSDLTKEIEHNGEKFVPIDEIQKLYPSTMDGLKMIDYVEESGKWMLNTNRDGEVAINIMRRIDEKLFSWHFDNFDLIEKGLAIDINTLK